MAVKPLVRTVATLSYRPLELYTILGLLFLAIILPITILSKKLEFKERIKKKNKAKALFQSN